ncbi:Hint domain-containing protein [Aliiroseovarius crassostreae]|uniref:Hint domain-containing protein n=1 Tax=Aliiroseovarius crassostreae TaxID=154981 RepID=UPI003C7CD8B6
MPQSPSGTPDLPPLPTRTIPVHHASDFRAVQGVNEGDALGDARELLLEDAYMLTGTPPSHLSLTIPATTGPLTVAEGSQEGIVGAPLFLDCLLTLMPPHGDTIEALVLVETTADAARINNVYLYPLTALAPNTPYTLVTINTDDARARLAETASVSFTRGTRITMADGRQKPIEELAPGDRILTRDSGPQPVRWIGQQTVRATGAFAPITIAAGALSNDAELTLSPSHRLFIYQRVDALKAGQKEVLVRAQDLVNGQDVTQSEGGFVDYFQLLFDKHEIIYAEGIPSESLFVDHVNRPALPDELPSHEKGAAAQELGRENMKSGLSTDALRAVKGAGKR